MNHNTKNYREQGGDRWVVGGELDILAGGELKLAGEGITEQLNAGLALVGAMVGGYAEAAFDDGATVQDVIAASGAGEGRVVLLIIKITADVEGTTKPVFQIGEEDTLDKFIEIGEGKTYEDPSAGDVIVASGALTAEKALTLKVASAGATGNGGALQVFAIVLPDEA